MALTADVKLIQRMHKAKGRGNIVMLGTRLGARATRRRASGWRLAQGSRRQALIFEGDADKKWRRAMDKRQVPL